ncbi:MAG: YdeI/OmpD-associated family protein [Candidatus Kapaibacterium sp.]
MSNYKTLYITNRKSWREWLEKNFQKEKEVWLIYPKKASGKKRIPYNDAVEEALCFGWIDSTIKTYDEECSMQRFTPRNPKSKFSQPNKERLRWLAEHDMLHPSVREKADEILAVEFVFPDDLIEIIKSDPEAWKNYRNFSEAYKRIRIAYIDQARPHPEEYEKRLNNFLKKTRENKLIAYGGIEKHF